MQKSAGFLGSANSQSARRQATARRWLIIGATAVTIAACSRAHLSTKFPPRGDESSPIKAGVFKDSNVAGLDFVSGQENGVTDAQGRFTCETDQQVRFSIGNVELGETECATLAHPAALTASGSLSDPKALNITRFLMLLDDDQDPKNGIVISDTLRTLSENWAPIDFSATDFAGEVAQVMSDIASVGGGTVPALPSNTAAFTHLDSSLSCAYSGVFISTFSSGPFAARTDLALAIYREPGATTDTFLTEIVRIHPTSTYYFKSSGIVELKTLPSLGADPSGAVIDTIDADFTSPDALEGTWEGGLSQQNTDSTGSFLAYRIGDISGEHRFTGTFIQQRDTLRGSQPAIGYAVLTLDGTEISGEAFDILTGFTSVVTGERLPDSAQAELHVDQLGVKYSGTVSLAVDEDGSPIGMQGRWPGLETSTFTAVGCRL